MKTEITMAIISRGIFTSIVPNDLVSICVSNRNATKKFGANVIPTNKKGAVQITVFEYLTKICNYLNSLRYNIKIFYWG